MLRDANRLSVLKLSYQRNSLLHRSRVAKGLDTNQNRGKRTRARDWRHMIARYCCRRKLAGSICASHVMTFRLTGHWWLKAHNQSSVLGSRTGLQYLMNSANFARARSKIHEDGKNVYSIKGPFLISGPDLNSIWTTSAEIQLSFLEQSK